MATSITAQAHAQDLVDIARHALNRVHVMQLSTGEKRALELAYTTLSDLHASLPQLEDSAIKL